MLSILEYEGGRKSLTGVMEALSISSKSAGTPKAFLERDSKREKLKKDRQADSNTRYLERLSAAQDSLKGRKSYSPGVCDAGDGPSREMVTMPMIASTANVQNPSVSEFVVIPYGPTWYAARITQADAVNREVELEFMYSGDGNSTFHWKEEGDPGYEGLCWEPSSKILCTVNEPTPLSLRCRLYKFSDSDMEKIKTKFSEWRSRKVQRKPSRQ